LGNVCRRWDDRCAASSPYSFPQPFIHATFFPSARRNSAFPTRPPSTTVLGRPPSSPSPGRHCRFPRRLQLLHSGEAASLRLSADDALRRRILSSRISLLLGDVLDDAPVGRHLCRVLFAQLYKVVSTAISGSTIGSLQLKRRVALQGLPADVVGIKETVTTVKLGTSSGFYTITANHSNAAVAQIASSATNLRRYHLLTLFSSLRN
jgi:hypothetical protein